MSETPAQGVSEGAVSGSANEVAASEQKHAADGDRSSSSDTLPASSAAVTSGHGSRKRIKASRACDQCRKRKIKCDHDEQRGICTSCMKNGEKCTFERVPLKRGPSKGYTRSENKSRSRSTSFSNDANNNTGVIFHKANSMILSQDVPSPSSRTGSVLLPPLAQYLPQSNGPFANNNNSSYNPMNTSGAGLGQQQFWKVPYHEFANTRRGSIDSLQSDLSGKSLSAPQEQQLLYSTPSVTNSHGIQSPKAINNGNSSLHNEQPSGYWSFLNRSNQSQPSYSEDIDEARRKSSSFPPILRNPPNTGVPTQQQQQQQQVLYPYSQFSQQQRPTLNPSLSSFGQFGTGGFESRQGSIASEGMSPSAPLLYQSPSMTPTNSTANSAFPIKNDNTQKALPQSQIQQKPQFMQQQPMQLSSPAQRQQKATQSRDSSGRNSDSSKSTTTKKRKKISSHKKTKSANSNISNHSNNSSNVSDNASSVALSLNHGIIYGQISDVDLIDTYYEFIHTGFPIIPLNKMTLTNEILLVNTQPISAIHEVNNYVIIWFRNSLELLVRISLKKRYSHFFDGAGDNGVNKNEQTRRSNSNGSNIKINDTHMTRNESSNYSNNDNDNRNSINDESLEIKTVFISALNECLQKIVDVHPRFREIKGQISPKIKIIYLSTFILLNYILAFVGYDNSFVLGMSVTIFKEFRVHELLLFDNDEVGIDNDLSEHSIMFKRLYVLLIIFDSLQSCMYGGPKLINIPIQGSSDKFFQASSMEDSKWIVDESPKRIKCILKSIQLGELINEIAMNRRSICDYKHENLVWHPSTGPTIASDQSETLTTTSLFHDLLLLKISLTNELLTVDNSIAKISKISSSLCELISKALDILTSMIKSNPSNRIDYNFRPLEEPEQQIEHQHKGEENYAPSGTEHGANTAGNVIYQKLLGLQQDKKGASSNLLRGIVSPYCVSMVNEIANILDLIKQLPTSLIGLVVQTSMGESNAVKPQNLVVELSNSMNEMITITNLLNMIKPLKFVDPHENSRGEAAWKRRGSDSVIKSLYLPAPPDPAKVSTAQAIPHNLQTFADIGWRLLDDTELGWC